MTFSVFINGNASFSAAQATTLESINLRLPLLTRHIQAVSKIDPDYHLLSPPTAPTLVPAIIFLALVIATALDVLPASALAPLQCMLETAQGDPLKQKPEYKPSLLPPPSATGPHPIQSSSHGPYSGLRGPCDPALLPQSYSISFHLARPTMPSCPIISQTPQQLGLGILQLLSLSPPALLSPGPPHVCSAVSSSEACPGRCI